MTVLGESIERNRKSAASLRREQDDAKLRKLESYSKYDGRVTRVYTRHGLPELAGIGGYIGGIVREPNRDDRLRRNTFTARTFNPATGAIVQQSGPLTSRRAAMLWLANVAGLTA